jgi:hypothetical protein
MAIHRLMAKTPLEIEPWRSSPDDQFELRQR